MISLFRNFFQSKIGLPIFIGFLILVGFAFAMADVTGSGTFGGLTGDDKVAAIDGESIGARELQSAVDSGHDRARQQNPTLTIPQFVESGGFDVELDLLIDRTATGYFAKKYGLRAGDNLINSEILQIGAFRNLTGEFDEETYRNALQRQGITDAILRKDIGDGLLNQQVLRPAFAAPQLPLAAARQYTALVLERRIGSIALVPSSVFAPTEDPSEEQLAAFYAEAREDFVLPELRTIRTVSFGENNFPVDIEPTEEQIAARYEQDAALYAAQERRAITSFVVPTEDAAQALVERIRGGEALELVARDAGFNVQTNQLRDRAELEAATSAAVADAVFAGERGAIADAAEANFVWTVARIDEIEETPARSLAQVSDDIAAQLRSETRASQLIELSANIEEQVDGGTSLVDVAEQFGLEVFTTPRVTPEGQIYGTLQGVNPAMRPILETAFQMDESEPQLAELVPGSQFMIFDVSDIVESAAPPIEDVRGPVTAAWRRSEGAKVAKEAADRVSEAVSGGETLRAALVAENSSLTQIDEINVSRQELLSSTQGRIPSALVLMFSMAQGSTKVLEQQGDLGWFVINLDTIETEEVEDDNPILTSTQAQIAVALSSEYNSQLALAIREEMGVELNEEAIEAVRRTLTGEN